MSIEHLVTAFLEIVYKDAIELEVDYKGTTLAHKFYPDFVLFDKIILEVKAAEGGLADDQIAQTLKLL